VVGAKKDEEGEWSGVSILLDGDRTFIFSFCTDSQCGDFIEKFRRFRGEACKAKLTTTLTGKEENKFGRNYYSLSHNCKLFLAAKTIVMPTHFSCKTSLAASYCCRVIIGEVVVIKVHVRLELVVVEEVADGHSVVGHRAISHLDRIRKRKR